MMKKMLKLVCIGFFAILSTVAIADGAYDVKVLAGTKPLLMANDAPNDTVVVVINFTDETVQVTSPIPSTIQSNQHAWIKRVNYTGSVPVRIVDSKNTTIFDKAVSFRTSISVKKENNKLVVEEKPH